MAIKRLVSVTCDGPCGLVLPDCDRIPDDWFYLRLQKAHQGQNEKAAYDHCALCPSCTQKAFILIGKSGFAWLAVNKQKENI